MSLRRQLFAKKPLALLLEEMKGENRLRRVLGPVGLTSLGVGAIIGTGIFVLIGEAAHDKAGPAVMVSFVVAGIACILAALCYAEFASMVPVAGSAYTYAYATLGELAAWIMGWDLLLEYAVSASAVAVGWSKYFQALWKIFIGEYTIPSPIYQALVRAGVDLTKFPDKDKILHLPKYLPYEILRAPFEYVPEYGKLVGTGAWVDLPAVIITGLLTVLLVIGIRESARFNNTMVLIKLAIVVFVIAVGAFYINPANWTPFAPYGWTGLSFFGHTAVGMSDEGGKPLGMLAGSAIIFFSYIGFDSISTHSEEARNPQRDVPIGIIASLLICTVLYIAVSAVLTGMVSYRAINIDAPVSDAFRQRGLFFAEGLIAIGALTGITSVLLVMLLSQPRILLAMARDGMIPPGFFGDVHSRFRTPWKSTILTGAFVALLAALLPLRILAELVSIGTLLAFVIVCAAVLIMRRTYPDAERPFRAPLVPLTPILGIATCLLLMFSLPAENWLRLLVWLAVGLVIYFTYSRHHSVMAKDRNHDGSPPGPTDPNTDHPPGRGGRPMPRRPRPRRSSAGEGAILMSEVGGDRRRSSCASWARSTRR
jgi:APA family basic amino acid/polyamine antiporter